MYPTATIKPGPIKPRARRQRWLDCETLTLENTFDKDGRRLAAVSGSRGMEVAVSMVAVNRP
jgi:hypothetical protein